MKIPTKTAYYDGNMFLGHISFLTLILALLFTHGPAQARESVVSDFIHAVQARPPLAPSSPQIDVGFSPSGGAEELVIRMISSAKSSLLVGAYSFTNKNIAEALQAAAKRGVDVRVVVDKSQKTEKYSSATFLANTGIPVRVDSRHAIMHWKVICADHSHLSTGSYNFTSSATSRNAENVIAIWNNPSLVSLYENEWRKHWDHSEPFLAKY